MKYLNYKLKFIYWRYVVINLGSVLGYSLFNICFFQSQLISIKDNYYELLIPFLLPLAPLIFWLRPRLKLLKLERKNGKNLFDFYLVIAWVATIAPTIFAQKYITAAVGKLSTVKTVNGIERDLLTKFYRIDEIYLDKRHCSVQLETHAVGKSNRDLIFTFYAAVPIYDKPILPALSDSAAQNTHPFMEKEEANYRRPKAWLGWKMTQQISNRLKKETKDSLYRIFLKHTNRHFAQDKIYGFNYLQKIGPSNDLENFESGITYADPGIPKNPIVLIPKYTSFEKRGIDMLYWACFSLGIGNILWFMMLLATTFKEEKLQGLGVVTLQQ